MIPYEPGEWSVTFAFQLHGSVFPKASVWAAPASILSMIGHHLMSRDVGTKFESDTVGTSILGGFTFILGFLIVFRVQQAYHRWWEGGTLLQQLRGEWFNAFSSLLAFCNSNPAMAQDVTHFKHRLVRLSSLLYMVALEQVTTCEDRSFEVIDLEGFEPESLHFMQDSHDRCEVVLQWIQRLIYIADDAQIIKVAPPILSRVYNQLGNGIVNLNNARKITDFPIPFPLAQMVTIMLLCHFVVTTIICASSVDTLFWCGFLSFTVVFSFQSVNYIAVELEMPFGDDANDLPLQEMQEDFIKSLKALMHPTAQTPPNFNYKPSSEAMTSGFLELNRSAGLDAVINPDADGAVPPADSKNKVSSFKCRQKKFNGPRRSTTISSIAQANNIAAGATQSPPGAVVCEMEDLQQGDGPRPPEQEVLMDQPEVDGLPLAQPEPELAPNQDMISDVGKEMEYTKGKNTVPDQLPIQNILAKPPDRLEGAWQETTATTAQFSLPELPWLDKFLQEHILFQRDILGFAREVRDLLERNVGRPPDTDTALRMPVHVEPVCCVPAGGQVFGGLRRA